MGVFHVNFANVFSTVYGNGGSGEPTRRDEFQGTRSDSPKGGSAAAQEQNAAVSAPAIAARNVEAQARSTRRLQLKANHPIDEKFRESKPGPAVRHRRLENPFIWLLGSKE